LPLLIHIARIKEVVLLLRTVCPEAGVTVGRKLYANLEYRPNTEAASAARYGRGTNFGDRLRRYRWDGNRPFA
jgi:hypothetical protein